MTLADDQERFRREARALRDAILAALEIRRLVEWLNRKLS